MLVSELLAELFPHLGGVRIDRVFRSGSSIRIRAQTLTIEAACPACGTTSRRVHSQYERRLSDTAVSGQELLILLRVSRFFCPDPGCAKKTFAEQVPGLTSRYGRRSIGLRDALQAIALALGGRAGARLAERLSAAVSRMTLIRVIRAIPELGTVTGPRILGVDDFALRRGAVYGTILIDIVTSRPVDVLPDRSADSLAAWLRAHPGVEIICRDRASCYVEGASRGAPRAIQVADRWHLWRNLGEAVERTVAQHRAHLRELRIEPLAATIPAPVQEHPPALRQDRWAARARDQHAAIHALISEGHALRAIAQELGLGRNTVRKFARVTDPEELLVHNGTGKRPKDLDEHEPYLRERWNSGCTNAQRLWEELRARGYQGASTSVRHYVQPWRTGLPAQPSPRAPLTVRQATGLLLRNPANLHPDDQHALNTLTASSPQLAALRGHVSALPR